MSRLAHGPLSRRSCSVYRTANIQISVQGPRQSMPADAAPPFLVARTFLAGAASTTVACCFTNPMETAKTRMQLSRELALETGGQRYRNVFHALLVIGRQEGIRGLQSGLLPALGFQVALNGPRLGLYPVIENGLYRIRGTSRQQQTGTVAGTTTKLIAGAAAGAVGAFIASPFNLLKSRLQSQSKYFIARQQYNYSGPVEALRAIIREDGVRGMWRGSDAAMLRVALGSSAQLMVYDNAKSWIRTRLQLSDGVSLYFLSAMVSGAAVAMATNPVDVVNTRIYQAERGFYRSPIDCLARTVRSEGIRGLYKGVGAQYARTGPHTLLTFLLLEPLFRLLGVPPR